MVTINPKPIVTVNSSVGVCPHDTVILQAVDADPLDRYHWKPSLYLDDTTSASVIARPVNNMTYTVITTNKFNCYDTAVISVTVRSGALLELGDSITLYPGESVQLNPLTNCSSFTWFPPAGLSNAHVSDPLASPEISTKYTVRGVTDWGCKAVDSISIYVNPESLVSLPNAFTPGSSANNEFKILMRGVAKLNYFRIWDRWGVKVFETTNINKGWDGTYNGKNQPFGVYMYQVEAVTGTGRTFVKSGNITLIR
jgi:gliding motility-associated-like protein